MDMMRTACAILGISLILDFGAAAAERVTYTKDVAPIFNDHCVACHRPNQVAPMSLLSHAEARPWAKSIAQKVSNGEMPPWSGESDKRIWSNDISLTSDEVATIVQWVEQGAREGDPKDMPNIPEFSDSWTLGEPDYVIDLDAVAVPAGGEDIFPKQWVTVDIDEPQWIQAIEFLPGDRRVTHHFQSTYNSPAADSTIGSRANSIQGILAIWTAGMPPYVFPEGMGRIINPGTKVLIDSHYHPFGEAITDSTKIGLYFGKGEIKKEVATFTAVNTGMRIPPGEANHAEKAFHIFDRDMQILAFSPHMHVRGKAMRYDLTYPDGTVETLLDVPKYNYNWQWLYYPTEPIDVPMGSRMDVTGVWDNSADNPFNPDPTKEIIYRGNTFNEMFVGFFEAIETNKVYHEPPAAKDKLIDLLREHPAEDSYFVGGFLPFGLYVPKEGEGWMYLVQNGVMFTISLDDIEWDGDRVFVEAQLPTPEASATATHINAELDDKGRLKGEFIYGVEVERPLKTPMLGRPMTEIDADKSARAGAR